MTRLHFILAGILFLFPATPRSAVAAEGASGLRVFTAGHSFHTWMPPILKEVAVSAGIAGHETAGVQSIGASRVIQHWDLADEKNKVKPVLLAGKADVLTLSPIFVPDPGIENFVKLGLEHNPAFRVTVMEFWMPFDDQVLYERRGRGPKIEVDRDTKTIEELRQAHAGYFQSMDENVRALNQQFGKPAVLVVPVGQAVLALRERIIKGEAPGITKQSELFTDALGHTRTHIQALATYCHFAVIYGRNPAGLPVPRIIAQLPEAEKLNRLLQELAWQAVTAHPLSGVKAGLTSR